MKIGTLIQILQDMVDDGLSEEAEVRLMTQGNYPFENRLDGVANGAVVYSESEDLDEPLEPGEVPECCDGTPADQVVFLVEGSQIGYGSKNAWNVCERS